MSPFIPVDITNHAAIALIYAAKLIILTIGLNMVYSVLKFSNFAHAEYITTGMFASWWLLQILFFAIPWDEDPWSGEFLGMSWYTLINNLFIQAMFAFIMVGLLGILGEILVFGRLRILRASPRTYTVASIGIGLMVRNFLQMVFGSYPKPNKGGTNVPSLPGDIDISIGMELTKRHPIFGSQTIYITEFKMIVIFMSIITVVIIDYIFRKTKFGIAMRATSDSIELAQVSGINTTRIIFYTWFLAAGLTGFGGAFVRATQGTFNALNGSLMLLPVFAVAILGGVGSFRGGIVAAFIIAYARETTAVLLTEFQKPLEELMTDLIGDTITFSPNYADMIGFVVLIIVLLFRPQGIFGSVEATRARV